MLSPVWPIVGFFAAAPAWALWADKVPRTPVVPAPLRAEYALAFKVFRGTDALKYCTALGASARLVSPSWVVFTLKYLRLPSHLTSCRAKAAALAWKSQEHLSALFARNVPLAALPFGIIRAVARWKQGHNKTLRWISEHRCRGDAANGGRVQVYHGFNTRHIAPPRHAHYITFGITAPDNGAYAIHNPEARRSDAHDRPDAAKVMTRRLCDGCRQSAYNRRTKSHE